VWTCPWSATSYSCSTCARRSRSIRWWAAAPGWLAGLPPGAAATLRALGGQFERAESDGVEKPEVFQVPDVLRGGGLEALKALGWPAEVLAETKRRMFAA